MIDKLKNANFIITVGTIALLPALIFEDVAWISKISGILFIIGAVMQIIECRRKNAKFSRYVIPVLLIAVSVYLILAV